jgi:3-deoxy-manno-octulosonate cytidylyltransferase (CMP-KDO synthetase)
VSTPHIIVPARLESTRFPRKLLHRVRGKPLLVWVAERIRAEAPEFPLTFAVDDPQLAEVLEPGGFDVVLTDPAHPSGTDRIAEANRKIGARRIINVQADEPLVTGGQIRQLAGLLARGFPMATLATPIAAREDFLNPNHVKVVTGSDGRALYFSRAPIPYPRDLKPDGVDAAFFANGAVHRHLGLYAYDAELLQKFTAWPPGVLERIERLEQLRVLENGGAIGVAITPDASIGVDTPEDAVKFERALGAGA